MSGVSHGPGGGAALVAVSVETAFFPMLVALNINCLWQTNSTIGGGTWPDWYSWSLLFGARLSRGMGLGYETESVLQVLDITMWFVSLSAANWKV